MSVSTIFSYRLKDAWGFPLCKVSVSVGGSKSRVRYKIVNEKRHSRQLNDDVICEINAIMEAHPKIWTYDEFSLEVPSGLLDGVMNFFEFATLDGKSVHFFASNIGEVRDPDAHFSLSLSFGANPVFLQEEKLELASYQFCMQIYGGDFPEEFQDIFYLDDAIGYLFLSKEEKANDVGVFFVQCT